MGIRVQWKNEIKKKERTTYRILVPPHPYRDFTRSDIPGSAPAYQHILNPHCAVQSGLNTMIFFRIHHFLIQI